MTEHRKRNVAHVVRCYELTPANRRQRLRTKQQRDRRAWTCAVMNERMRARAPHEIHCVVLNARFHARSRNLRTAMKERGWIRKRSYIDLIKSFRIEAIVPTRHYFALVILARIAQHYLELETIELRFGQWIRAFVFDRVLRRENGENGRQRVRIAVDRDLSLFHRLQQSGLSLWWRAIDLVRQQYVCEYWPTPQVERRVRNVEDVRAGDV